MPQGVSTTPRSFPNFKPCPSIFFLHVGHLKDCLEHDDELTD